MSSISPNDVVPALRNGVVFSSAPWGLGDGTLQVTNLANGEEVGLRGFESSLARMLDGHRTAIEVVDGASQIGLPMTLDELEGFVTKLTRHGLVGEQADVPAPRAARDRWDEATRQRF